MSWFQKVFSKREEEEILEKTEKGVIYSQTEGEIIPIEQIEDSVFSQELLGKGCGIKPAIGKIFAPFDGEVVMLAETKHALGLKNAEGIELLVHVGIDTVEMQGKGFTPQIDAGQKFKCGEVLLTFSIPEIEKAGYQTTLAIVVTNSESYDRIELLKQGTCKQSEKMLCVE